LFGEFIFKKYFLGAKISSYLTPGHGSGVPGARTLTPVSMLHDCLPWHISSAIMIACMTKYKQNVISFRKTFKLKRNLEYISYWQLNSREKRRKFPVKGTMEKIE
jgi:hypothetical protein